MAYRGMASVVVQVGETNVHIALEYEVTTDPNYGADADGNRGVRRDELEFVDAYIVNPCVLTPGDVQEALGMAKKKLCHQRGFNHE